ncbi:COMM domain-containing protein 6-like [Protopterus annectens]|uniref:COMM domain-containing protein 6-like n=1 Tax=Protopterus annectens TaxID=7888 RepID=UPI001CFA2CF0|nr:COMM domain-containing protein 6-like [Protopterus annectens]
MFADGLGSDFDSAVENIGKLPQDLFAELCQRVMFYLQHRTPGTDAVDLHQRFHRAGIGLSVSELETVINLISLVFRTTAKNNIPAEELAVRLAGSSNKWSKQAVQVIRHVWSEQGKFLTVEDTIKSTVTAGQLVDLQWKMGMTVSSSSCKSLNCPYVTVTLKVADTAGQITNKSFEMTIPQFQNFFRQFKEMASVLETV